MKKFISCFLAFVLLLSNTPIQIFAQDLGYKPAMSFEYDSYEVGKVRPRDFISNLEDDLLNGEDVWNPKSVAPVSRNLEGKPEHLRQSYNNFLYYNISPEESPLWNKTALIPDGEATQEDVLGILDMYSNLSWLVTRKLKQNPKYKKERLEKSVRLIPSILMEIALFLIIWEDVAPNIFAEIAATHFRYKKIVKAAATIALMAGDIFVSDQVAWEMIQSDERLVNLFQSVGSYKSTAIDVSIKTDLLKPVKQTEYDRIEKELKNMTQQDKPYNKGDYLLLKRYFKKGYSKIDVMYRPRLKLILGKFLYDLFDGDEVLINEYFRKELLRTYYALEFIKDELSNKEDPLRYDRAVIDLATTYKIQSIQILDNRTGRRGERNQVRSFADNLQYLQNKKADLKGNSVNSELFNYINQEFEKQVGSELDTQTSVMTTYPTMLTRAEVNYLVQLMDMHQKKRDYDEKVQTKRQINNRDNTYKEMQEKKESYSKSNHKVQKTGKEAIDKRLEKIHGEYYDFTSTK